MLSALQRSRLIEPALINAHVDRFSRLALDRVSQYFPNEIPTPAYGKPCYCCEQSCWVDGKVESFLAKHPQGVGIEVGCGLSTRFHRLSERSHWPRFSWLAINECEVADYIGRVFPPLDNHSNVPVSHLMDEWEQKICWHDRQAKILIINFDDAMSSISDFIPFYLIVCEKAAMSCEAFEVILTHRVPKLGRWLERLGDDRLLAFTACSESENQTILQRLLPLLFFKKNNSAGAVLHLTFRKKEKIL